MGADDKPFTKARLLRRVSSTARLLSDRPLLLVLLLLVFVVLFSFSGSAPDTKDLLNAYRRSPANHDARERFAASPYPYEEKGAFYEYLVHGYDNTGRPGGAANGHNLSCSAIGVQSEIGVQRAFDLPDDLTQVANELDDHPMIYYTQKVFGNEPATTFQLREVVEKSWDRLAGSCVLLPDRDVFLCIARIIFHDDARKNHIAISFLRGQIFSRSWVHLENYEFIWHGRKIVFPRIFDTGTEFVAGGDVFGPEDPRIIIEDGVHDAEPVIVFNMISEKATWKRAMWIFRPFSQHSTILTIKGHERNAKEKNWAPFFVDERSPAEKKKPRPQNRYVHFIYNFSPLEILRCSVLDGMCERVFMQNVPEDMKSIHDNEWSEIRGGTQWVPVPLPNVGKKSKSSPALQAWVSFPRTHTEQTSWCYSAVYRPEMVVMVSNGTEFFLTYVSGPLDFGPDVILPAVAYNQPCGEGRIFIINSIADWDLNARTTYTSNTDVMTLTVTLMDATVQAMRISGVLHSIYGLPSMQRLLNDPKDVFGTGKAVTDRHTDIFTKHSAVGHDVKSCAEEGVRRYIDDHIQGEDKPKLLEVVEKRKKGRLQDIVNYPSVDWHPPMEHKGH